MGALGSLVPLVILFAFVGGFAWVGYQMFIFANDLGAKGKAELQARNMHFTNEGMKIGVKHVNHEDYEDKTQSFLVNMWNHASFPGYKSRLWNTMAADAQQPDTKGAKPSASRTTSSVSVKQQ